MIIMETPVQGAFVIEPEFLKDERGFFARVFCDDTFRKKGMDARVIQSSVSFNRYRGTVRGMHFQKNPWAENKYVRCTSGAIRDVIVDIRPQSDTFKTIFSIDLTANNRKTLYMPAGTAHGFQTLADNTEVYYQMTVPYNPELAAGFRWDDSAFNIIWPLPVEHISEKDRNYPDVQL